MGTVLHYRTGPAFRAFLWTVLALLPVAAVPVVIIQGWRGFMPWQVAITPAGTADLRAAWPIVIFSAFLPVLFIIVACVVTWNRGLPWTAVAWILRGSLPYGLAHFALILAGFALIQGPRQAALDREIDRYIENENRYLRERPGDEENRQACIMAPVDGTIGRWRLSL